MNQGFEIRVRYFALKLRFILSVVNNLLSSRHTVWRAKTVCWDLVSLSPLTPESPSFLLCLCVSCSVVSNSLQPHGLEPTRLLCPWNSPGKNTGEGYHSLLQGLFSTQGWKPGLPHCRRIFIIRATRKPSSVVSRCRFHAAFHPGQYRLTRSVLLIRVALIYWGIVQASMRV